MQSSTFMITIRKKRNYYERVLHVLNTCELLWHYLCFNLIDRQHPTKLFYSVLHHIYVTQLDN
jgi:hypothetical protein